MDVETESCRGRLKQIREHIIYILTNPTHARTCTHPHARTHLHAHTHCTAVGAPPDVRTVATSPSAIAVTWNRAPTQGTHVSYYEVIYFKKEHQFAYNWLKNVRMSGSTPHTAQFPSEVSTLVTYETLTCLSGLSDSTTFVLAVRAHAGNLIGQFSGAVEVATLQSSAGEAGTTTQRSPNDLYYSGTLRPPIN